MNSGGDLLQIAYYMSHHTSPTLLHYHVKPSCCKNHINSEMEYWRIVGLKINFCRYMPSP